MSADSCVSNYPLFSTSISHTSFWRADLAQELLKDEIAVSVLYLETSEQINKQEIVVDPEVLKALIALKKKGLKKEVRDGAQKG